MSAWALPSVAPCPGQLEKPPAELSLSVAPLTNKPHLSWTMIIKPSEPRLHPLSLEVRKLDTLLSDADTRLCFVFSQRHVVC